MAKKKVRNIAVRINLTAQAYKMVEESAFKNCRTVSQELTYIVERQILREVPATSVKVAYDAPAPAEDVPPPPAEPQEPAQHIPGAPWTDEQEAQILAIGKECGMGEAEITMHKLLHKTFDATVASMRAEVAAA